MSLHRLALIGTGQTACGRWHSQEHVQVHIGIEVLDDGDRKGARLLAIAPIMPEKLAITFAQAKRQVLSEPLRG